MDPSSKIKCGASKSSWRMGENWRNRLNIMGGEEDSVWNPWKDWGKERNILPMVAGLDVYGY